MVNALMLILWSLKYVGEVDQGKRVVYAKGVSTRLDTCGRTKV